MRKPKPVLPAELRLLVGAAGVDLSLARGAHAGVFTHVFGDTSEDILKLEECVFRRTIDAGFLTCTIHRCTVEDTCPGIATARFAPHTALADTGAGFRVAIVLKVVCHAGVFGWVTTAVDCTHLPGCEKVSGLFAQGAKALLETRLVVCGTCVCTIEELTTVCVSWCGWLTATGASPPEARFDFGSTIFLNTFVSLTHVGLDALLE